MTFSYSFFSSPSIKKLALILLTLSSSSYAVDNKYQGQAGAKSATQATQSAISGAISGIGSHGMFRVNLSDDNTNSAGRGMAAGDGDSPWTLWATPVFARVNNRISPITSKGSVNIAMLGLEHNKDDELIRGVIIAFDRPDLDTPYNAGTIKGNGYTISPYLAMPLNDSWMLDMNIGIGQVDLDSNISGTTAKPKDSRTLVSIGVSNATQTKSKWSLQTKIGASYSRDEVKAYTDSSGSSTANSTSTLNQLKVGTTATYFGNQLKPFVGVFMALNDFSVTGGSDTKPKEYSFVPQLQLGITPSSGPWYASLSVALERDRSALRAYVGYRY